MTNSTLLTNLLRAAETLCKKHGGQRMNTDFFLLATIERLVDGGVYEGENEIEMMDVEDLISSKVPDYRRTYKNFAKAVKESNGGGWFGAFLFDKIRKAATQFAEERGIEEITTGMYIKVILEDPSKTIQEYLYGIKEEKPSSTADDLPVGEPEPAPEPAPIPRPIPVPDSMPTGETEEEPASTPAPTPTPVPKTEKTASAPTSTQSATPKASAKKAKDTTLFDIVDKVKTVQRELLDTVYGQDHAVNAFVSGYFQAELNSFIGETRVRPRAIYLFAGPPGVGKTFLAEQAAKALKLPFARFDMSEYADDESNIEFCGSDKVYKNGKAGNVTSYVAENPKCVILFDEVEKAHLNVIHLFLQILDAGRIRDNYTDEEVSFADTILIFTTNAGRALYEDPDITNLSLVSKKTVLDALATDVNPVTGGAMFPQAICSRFASGNVLMFNHLSAQHLLTIAKKEIDKSASSFAQKAGMKVTIDKSVPYAVVFAEGGNADARTVRGSAEKFFHRELYELLRLLKSGKFEKADALKQIQVKVELPSGELKALFEEKAAKGILVFADGDTKLACEQTLGKTKVFYADTVDKAKEILEKKSVSIILCDMACGVAEKGGELNAEDLLSAGRDFFLYATSRLEQPLYLINTDRVKLTKEEELSFLQAGARGVIELNANDLRAFDKTVEEKCVIAGQQNKLTELSKKNKILTYKTKQTVSADGKSAVVWLYDLGLETAADAKDSKNILSGVSKPSVRFADVVGAKDAKEELVYFVDYLKDPAKFIRRGVKAPKGILLYGPPGTGKTLLAKAMAGESDVTFIAAEGNQFLKKYVGEGSEKIHELFKTARKYAPSILFIDEIDAIAKNRSSESGEKTGDVLTALLTEMDGFKSNADKPVFVLAATNYSVEQSDRRSLDPAILRRFDRKILVDLPDKQEREQYLKMKMQKNPALALSATLLENVASRAVGSSIAELELIIELAIRNSIKKGENVVTDEIFENAFETYMNGEEKKWERTTVERTARHEAGHALLCWLSGETPSYLTIVSRGNHGGYMQHADGEDKMLYTRKELLGRIRTSLAGRAAELVCYGEEDGVSTGASGDLNSATRLAEYMICAYGMDETVGLGSIDLASISGSAYYTTVRNRVNEVLKEQLILAKKAVVEHKKAFDALVSALLEKSHLTGKEIDSILSKNSK